MKLNDTITESAKTWVSPKDAKYTAEDVELLYISNALGGEVGELQNKVKKFMRNKYWTKAHSTGIEKESIAEEVSDALFYLARIAALLGIDMEQSFAKKMQENAQRYVQAKK